MVERSSRGGSLVPMTQAEVAEVVAPEPEKSLQAPGGTIILEEFEEEEETIDDDEPAKEEVPMEDAVEDETKGKGVLEKAKGALG